MNAMLLKGAAIAALLATGTAPAATVRAVAVAGGRVAAWPVLQPGDDPYPEITGRISEGEEVYRLREDVLVRMRGRTEGWITGYLEKGEDVVVTEGTGRIVRTLEGGNPLKAADGTALYVADHPGREGIRLTRAFVSVRCSRIRVGLSFGDGWGWSVAFFYDDFGRPYPRPHPRPPFPPPPPPPPHYGEGHGNPPPPPPPPPRHDGPRGDADDRGDRRDPPPPGYGDGRRDDPRPPDMKEGERSGYGRRADSRRGDERRGEDRLLDRRDDGPGESRRGTPRDDERPGNGPGGRGDRMPSKSGR